MPARLAQRIAAGWSWLRHARRRTRWMLVVWSALVIGNVVGLVVHDQWSGWTWALGSASMIGVHIDAERTHRAKRTPETGPGT